MTVAVLIEMNMTMYLKLRYAFLCCLICSWCKSETLENTDKFNEELFIKPLPSGHVYVVFQFIVRKDTDHENYLNFKHFRLFPRSLGEIISKHSVQELHLSLTQGLWRHEKWGYPYRDAPPGAELWAWFHRNTSDVTSTWKNLANALSGQFCASLNFIDETNTIEPTLSFRPLGAVLADKAYNSSYLRYSSLPHETVCTENLTPFKKLLPCDTKAGLSTLLNAINIFNTHYISLAVDLRTVCKTEHCTSTALELKQSVSIVFDPPVLQQGKQDWSFVKMFAMGLMNTCPVATDSKVYIDISGNETGIPFTLTPVPNEIITVADDKAADPLRKDKLRLAVYHLKEIFTKVKQLNIAASYKKTHIYWLIPPPVLFANRYIAGFGQEQGGIHCNIHNYHPNKSLKIVYLEVIPWFLRLYTHTLSITNNGKEIIPEYQHYLPARDRKRPHHLELIFTLPPKSITEINIEFDRAFLKWTEYPPDANHGFYVGSAVISFFLDSDRNFTHFPSISEERRFQQSNFLRLYTQILLVSLPTPDFSMPYNVICLACTVVALAFGPIHNITTKRLCPAESNKSSGWLSKIKQMMQKWRGINITKKENIGKEKDVQDGGIEDKKDK